MQRKIIPVAIILMILAIISLPTHSNEYTGKSIQQTGMIQQVLLLPAKDAEEVDGFFTDSPTTILLSL